MTIIPPEAAGNQLCDDHAVLSYADIPRLLDELDHAVNANGRRQIHCIALAPENSLARVLILLYLLSAKINFYLQSPHVSTGAETPSFCDLILSVGSDPLSVASTLQLKDNPHYTGQRDSLFWGGGGLALFSSSGTSGLPKYVCYRQETLIRNAMNCVERFGFNLRSQVLVPVPTGHMYGMGVGLLPALLSGSALCLIEKSNIVKLLDRARTLLPDITLITPTLARMLLALGKPLAGKGRYITAGEKIKEDTWLGFESTLGPLINLYGCTEMGAMATTAAADGPEQRSEGIIQPLSGVDLRIAGNDSGELLCYHNAGFECYIDANGSPYAGKLIDGWYATRDLGTETNTGRFCVIGRIDNCINRSGFLVSLDEIASILEKLFPEINQAVVFAYDREAGLVTGLTAICELAGGQQLEEGLARRRCKAGMTSHLVPDVIRLVRTLPRLSNGKPDRAAMINQYKTIAK